MKRMICLMLVLSLVLGVCPAAFAAEADATPEVDILTEDLTRSDKWPTTFKDISKTSYQGEIKNISVGYGIYTNYYFNCNSSGKLRVEATLTSGAPGYGSSKCKIEIYDAVSRDLVASYDPGFESYSNTYISRTFTGLTYGVGYVVRFVNATSGAYGDGDSYGLHGSITVKWP